MRKSSYFICLSKEREWATTRRHFFCTVSSIKNNTNTVNILEIKAKIMFDTGVKSCSDVAHFYTCVLQGTVYECYTNE